MLSTFWFICYIDVYFNKTNGFDNEVFPEQKLTLEFPKSIPESSSPEEFLKTHFQQEMRELESLIQSLSKKLSLNWECPIINYIEKHDGNNITERYYRVRYGIHESLHDWNTKARYLLDIIKN